MEPNKTLMEVVERFLEKNSAILIMLTLQKSQATIFKLFPAPCRIWPFHLLAFGLFHPSMTYLPTFHLSSYPAEPPWPFLLGYSTTHLGGGCSCLRNDTIGNSSNLGFCCHTIRLHTPSRLLTMTLYHPLLLRLRCQICFSLRWWT